MKDLRDVISAIEGLEIDGKEEMIAVMNAERQKFNAAEATARTATKKAEELSAEAENLREAAAGADASLTDLQKLQRTVEALQGTLAEKDKAIAAREQEKRQNDDVRTIASALESAGMNSRTAEKLARADYMTGAVKLTDQGIEYEGRYFQPAEYAERTKTDMPEMFGAVRGQGTQPTKKRSAEPTLEGKSTLELFTMAMPAE